MVPTLVQKKYLNPLGTVHGRLDIMFLINNMNQYVRRLLPIPMTPGFPAWLHGIVLKSRTGISHQESICWKSTLMNQNYFELNENKS